MKKLVTMCVLALCLALVFAMPVSAAQEEGTCGDGLTWSYSDGVLIISGAGEMDDYGQGAPWDAYREEIEHVILQNGVTYIGACAFRDYDALKQVDFGEALYQLGKYAFESCDGLTILSLPDTFKLFDEGCLQNCTNLEEIHCAGRIPSFRQNSVWQTSATIFYPADRPWGLEYIVQLETAFQGRIEFRASDGTDPYNPQPEAEETRAPETEPATEPETEPPVTTEPPTEPVTEPAPTTTEPEVTEPPTEAPTEAPTEPEETEEPAGIPNVTVLLLALLTLIISLTLIIVIILIGKGRKGRYAR